MEENSTVPTISKKPWIAVLLTLLTPGLGHFYSGQIRKAIWINIGVWVLSLAGWFIPFLRYFGGLLTFACLAFAYTVFILIDSAVTARRSKLVERKRYDRWYTYLLIVVGFLLLFELVYEPAKEKFAKYQFAASLSYAMLPTLAPGDKFAWEKTSSITKNDIAVFGFSDDPNSLYVFRCVAEPGDRLDVRQGLVYINGKLSDSPERLKFQYSIRTNGNCLNLPKLGELGFEELISPTPQDYVGNLTIRQVEILKNLYKSINVTPLFAQSGEPKDDIFPFSTKLSWNVDFYGPLTLPRKGETVTIDAKNAPLYGAIIRQCENESVVEFDQQGLLLINGLRISTYTFKHGYYFMLGDSRHNAGDSRIKGVVPDSLVRGKVLYKWWSGDRNSIGDVL